MRSNSKNSNNTKYSNRNKKSSSNSPENEEVFRYLFENNSSAIAIIDRDTTISMVNQAYCRMSGYTRDEVVGSSWTEQLPILELDRLKEYNRQRLIDPESAPESYEFSFYHKNGNLMYGLISVAVIQDGQKIIASFTDITERKQAEEAIRLSETRLKRAELASKSGNWELYLDSQTIIASEGAMIVYGLDSNQFEFSVIKTIPLPNYRPILDVAMKELIEFNKPYDLDFEIKAVNSGEIKNIHSIAIMDPERRIIFGIIQDITIRKKAEEALNKSEYNFRLLVENAPEAIFIQNRLHFSYLNCAALKFFGADYAGQLIGEPLMDRLHPEYRDRVRERIRILNDEAKAAPPIELKYLKLDGTVIEAEVSAIPFMFEGQDGGLVFIRDITDQKRIEKEIREGEKQLRTVIENASVGVCLVGLDGKFITTNQLMSELVGYSNEELLQFTFNDITHIEDREIGSANAKLLISGKLNKVSIEKRYIHKDGHSMWGLVSTSLIRNGNNEPKYFVTHVQDITERKLIEKELIAAKEKAEESDRLKTAFLHNISHEIRTPMNAIVGFSGLIKDPNLHYEKRSYYTDIINQSTTQLLSIITDIVNIATIEAGQEKINEKAINLNAVCKFLYEQFFSKATRKGVSFRYKISDEDDHTLIITDETKLIQILTNLIGNALKFTNEGYVEFGFKKDNSDIEFFVKDTGIGIPEELHEEIFKRFRQADISDLNRYGGSGLGLSISKAYVEILGGKIWLNSEPDKGSVFYFKIPFKTKNLIATPESKIIPGVYIKTKKPITILIAEDEETNFLLLERFLSKLNFNIIRAKHGLEAIEFCKSNPQIDIVLMDMKMPGLDGYEATKQIRDFRPDLPVIAQSAYTSEKDIEKAKACGCSDFVTKPFTREIILTKINEYLKKDV